MISDRELKNLESTVKKMEKVVSGQSFFELDRQFHLEITKASKNRFLLNIQSMIWDVIEKSQRLSYDKVANQHRLAEHQLILQAISLRDVDLAKAHILSHLEKIIDTYQSEPQSTLKS
jgi:DNA-binding FadR family transcriptional regulator